MTASSAVTLMSLNLRFGRAKDGPNSWSHRRAALAELLAKYPTDVCQFQEVNDFQADFLRSSLPHHRFIGQRPDAPAFWQNNVIAYPAEWTCRRADHFFLSPTPDIPSRDRRSRWPRQATIGHFATPFGEWICVDTHFDFDPQLQADCARRLLARLSRFSSEVPVVLSGDFNATPESPCRRVFEGTDDNGTGPHRFRSVFKGKPPATYHGFSGSTDGKHIDWILFSGNLRLLDAEVIQTPFSGRYPSDHYPVRARFAFGA